MLNDSGWGLQAENVQRGANALRAFLGHQLPFLKFLLRKDESKMDIDT
jgi:hypothetical protein